MNYEIINPSDAYTISAPDLAIAACACVLLGSGQYGFKPEDESAEEVPLFIFGGVDDWCKKHFGQDFDLLLTRVMDLRPLELADCLDSCLIGDFAARSEYESALSLIESAENRETFRARRHDKRRSSLNNIGGRAYEMAKRLREKSATPTIPAPQQVFVGD